MDLSFLLDVRFWLAVIALAGLVTALALRGRARNAASKPDDLPRLSVQEFMAEVEKRGEGEKFTGHIIHDHAEALSLQLGMSIGQGHAFRTRLVDEKTLWVEATRGRSLPLRSIDEY